MFQSPEAYIEEFKQRQNCPHVLTDDRMQMVFENGARIQIRNDRGEPDVGGEVEPPFLHEEDRLRRELDYWKIKHRREYDAWSRFKADLTINAANAANGMEVPLPSDQQLAQLDAGKVRLDSYAEKIASLSSQIVSLPRFVELERQRVQTAADRAARVTRAKEVLNRLGSLSAADPKSLEHAALNQ